MHANKKISLIAIYTLTDLSEEEKLFRFQPDLFDHVIYLNDENDLDKVADELKKLNTDYVFYGYEVSVPVADKISNLVCPAFSNNEKTSLLRCDKFEMNEILKQHNI